jgi:hypothetical protein
MPQFHLSGLELAQSANGEGDEGILEIRTTIPRNKPSLKSAGQVFLDFFGQEGAIMWRIVLRAGVAAAVEFIGFFALYGIFVQSGEEIRDIAILYFSVLAAIPAAFIGACFGVVSVITDGPHKRRLHLMCQSKAE